MPRKGQHPIGATNIFLSCISIHAPLMPGSGFQFIISIHAPLRGATSFFLCMTHTSQFQSTPLCEGRPHFPAALPAPPQFQSTPLCEGRLHPVSSAMRHSCISIHAPLRGATIRLDRTQCIHVYFNPRPSARGDPVCVRQWAAGQRFQSTPLCEGRRKILPLPTLLQ